MNATTTSQPSQDYSRCSTRSLEGKITRIERRDYHGKNTRQDWADWRAIKDELKRRGID